MSKPGNCRIWSTSPIRKVVEPGLEDDLFFRPARFSAAKVREVHTFNAILELVATGAGFTILSRREFEGHKDRSSLVPLRLTAKGLKVAWSSLVRGGDAHRTELAEIVEAARMSEGRREPSE